MKTVYIPLKKSVFAVFILCERIENSNLPLVVFISQ